MNAILKTIYSYGVRHVCEIILLICLYISIQQQIQNNNLKEIIRSDGIGYYSYLPAIFIYHDYKFSFIDNIKKKHDKANYEAIFLTSTSNGKVDKYFIGLSLLWLPFFLIAHFLSHLLGLQSDGYSLLYQISLLMAANFYLWLGCRYTRKMLLQYLIPQSVVAFIILLLVFGTNLSFYTTFDPELSHVYSFAMIAAFLYFIHSFFKSENKKHLYISIFIFGIIVLVRPSNAVVALVIPFFGWNYKTFMKIIKKHLKDIVIGFLLLLTMISLQLVLYYLQTGHFIVWSYGEERFYFANPQMFNVLVSYRKGLFVYVPLSLVSLVGLVFLYRVNKFQFAAFLFSILLFTYVISCWWCWWYGASFGQRAFVDYYSLLGLLLGFTYSVSKNKYYRLLFFMITLLVVPYSSILSYQYRNYIIDWGEMNKNKFWFTFLKTNEKYNGLAFSRNLFSGDNPINIVSIKSSNQKYICSETDGSNYLLVNKTKAGLWESFNMIRLMDNKIAFEADNGKYISTRLDSDNALMNIGDKIDKWEEFELIRSGENNFILKACNNKFVSLEDEKLFANSDSSSRAEIFSLEEK
jgi:hypothetical protein